MSFNLRTAPARRLDPDSFAATATIEVRPSGGGPSRRQITDAQRVCQYEANVGMHGRTRLTFEAIAASDGLVLNRAVGHMIFAINPEHIASALSLRTEGLAETFMDADGAERCRLTQAGRDARDRYHATIALIERAANFTSSLP